MSRRDVSTLTNAEIVLEFVELCRRQNIAMEEEDMSKYRRLLRRQMAFAEELKGRPGDQRSALVPLYEHDDLQVRLISAEMTLAVEPVKARATLDAIRSAKMPPYSFAAGMTIRMLDDGIFTPS